MELRFIEITDSDNTYSMPTHQIVSITPAGEGYCNVWVSEWPVTITTEESAKDLVNRILQQHN